MARKFILILLGILIFAFCLRAYKVSSLPLYGDELTMVYDSYSLLKTGKDQTGETLPLTFKMGAGRPAGYVYFSIPFVAVFGPGAWGVRGLSVLSSLGVILVVFLLVRRLFNEKVALIAAFLVAVSPWDISLARGGFESHFALFLALLGIYFLIKSKNSEGGSGRWNTIFAIVLWGLTINTYPIYKLVLPLLLTIIVWYVGGIKKILPNQKIILLLSVVISAGIIAVTVAQTFVGGSENRFLDINVFSSNKSAVEEDINFNRSVDSGNAFVKKLFYNKPLSYFKLLGGSYLKNFSLEFLIINGDKNPRHNMVGTGVVYTVEILTILIGALYLFNKKEKRRDFMFVLAWLLVAPIASAFTLDNHGLRTNFMLPSLIIFSSLGIYSLVSSKKKIVLAVVLILWLVQFVPMLERLYFLSLNRFARFWSNMARSVAIDSNNKKDNYDFVIISSRIDNVEYAYNVYNKIDPNLVIDQYSTKTILSGNEFKKFDNVYIGSVPQGKLLPFLNSLEGKVRYYGPFDEANILGKYEKVLDLDNVASVAVYEK